MGWLNLMTATRWTTDRLATKRFDIFFDAKTNTQLLVFFNYGLTTNNFTLSIANVKTFGQYIFNILIKCTYLTS